MSLEDRFNQAMTEWKEHCGRHTYRSSTAYVHDCEPFRTIVSMSYAALPLIQRFYQKTSSETNIGMIKDPGLLAAVMEIIGEDEFYIPGEVVENILAMEQYTQDWLEQNISRYCKKNDAEVSL